MDKETLWAVTYGSLVSLSDPLSALSHSRSPSWINCSSGRFLKYWLCIYAFSIIRVFEYSNTGQISYSDRVLWQSAGLWTSIDTLLSALYTVQYWRKFMSRIFSRPDDPVTWYVSLSSVCAVQKRLNGSRSCFEWRLLGNSETLYIGVAISHIDSMRPSLNYWPVAFIQSFAVTNN